MEYKSLILGIVFSVGIFAVKSGVGLSYGISKTGSVHSRATVYISFALVYFLVFGASGMILDKLDLMHHLEAVQKWLQSGTLVHLLMAILMSVWGVWLLKGAGSAASSSKGWLMLALPCPVCATVILFSSGFLAACFPQSPVITAFALYLVFMLINLATVRVMHARSWRLSPESSLGGFMFVIAGYFFISMLVMPSFADLDNIYRMASYPTDQLPANMEHWLMLTFGATAAFLTGFGAAFYKIRRTA